MLYINDLNSYLSFQLFSVLSLFLLFFRYIFVSCLFLRFGFYSYICDRKTTNERTQLCHE